MERAVLVVVFVYFCLTMKCAIYVFVIPQNQLNEIIAKGFDKPLPETSVS
jgi:hypothetical protein